MTLFDGFDEAAASSATAGPSAAAPPLARFRATVAYDGSGFRGFAANPGVTTVGGTLEATLTRVSGHPITITCAGRTDAGVHARGQVISFDAPAGLDVAEVQRAVNKLGGGAVVLVDLAPAPPGFDARFSARSRTYRYTVLNSPVPDPFRRGTAWHVEAPLDLAVLRLGCDPFIGSHDFSSFCRAPRRARTDDRDPPSLVRRVLDARWVDDGDGLLRFWIEANAFCHQMVRSIVGQLVDVGVGRCSPGELRGILAARDRHAAGTVAPPHGLCLWSVQY